MSDVTDAIREKYPQYADVPEDQLVQAIGAKYPQYLKSSAGFKQDFLKGQLAAGRNVRPATTIGELPSALFTPSDEQREQAAQEVSDMKAGGPLPKLNEGEFQIPRLSPLDVTSLTGVKGRAASIASGVQGAVAGAGEGLLSPEGAGLFGPAKVAKAIGTAFVAQMAKSVPEQLSQAAGHYSAGDTESGDTALINGLVTAGMIAIPAAIAHRNPPLESLVGKERAAQIRAQVLKGGESNASSKQKTAEVHGDVQPQSVEGEGKVPAQEGGGGVQLPAKTQAKVLLNPFKLEQDEDGKYVITDPSGGVVSEHATQQEAREAMDKLKVSGGRSTGTPLEQASAAAKAQGYELRAVPQAGAVKLEGLPEEQKAKLLAAQPPQWEFTNPKTGVTTYLPEGATPEQVTEHLKQKDKVVAAGDAAHKAVVPALSPEDQAHIDAERGNVSAPVELVSETDTGNPFAQHVKGKVATIDRKGGKILINPKEFTDWLKDIPQAMKRKAVASLLSEEQIHLHTDDAAADAYWNTLTPREKLIVRRRYAGSQLALRGMNKTLWGHEALRFRMQQLTRMTPREIADAVGKEKWKLKALTVVETAIRGIRQTLGTKASKEATAILDKIQSNLDLAKTASKGANPAALSKKAKEMMMSEADKLDEQAKMYVESGDAQSGLELKGMAEKLRQQYFDESFKEPAARRRKESDDQLKMGDILAGDKFAGMKLAGAGNEAALSKAEKEMFDRAQAESGQKNFPGARPKKRHESIFQEGFILPGSDQGKVATGEGRLQVGSKTGEDIPKPEAVSAEAAGALPRLTGLQLQSKATDYINQSVMSPDAPVPRFNNFVEHMKGVDPSLKPGQLHEMWYQGIANRLSSATGEELASLVKKVWGRQVTEAAAKGGKKAFFRGIISGSQAVPDLPPSGQFKLESDVPGRTAAERYQDERKVAQIARSRDKVIGALFNKLAKVTLPDIDFHDATTEPEDLRYGGGKVISSVQDFTAQAERNPHVLGEELTDEARRSGNDPVTATKRLTAIMDRKTGTVDLVGTYKHPNGTVMLVDPNSPNRTHSPLDSILRRYRVIQSVLRDQPVQGFKQHFKSLEEYNDKFANEARDRYRAETSYNPEGMGEEEFMSTVGGRIQRGSGGSFMGPGRSAIQEEGNALERSQRTPMTVPEAEAIIDHALGEQGTIDSPDDIREAMLSLKAFPNRQAISAYSKLARGIQNANPDLTNDEILQRVAQRIYENHTQSQSLEEFARRTMAESRPAPVKAAGTEVSQADTRKELTMPINRRPPTDVRGLPAGKAPPVPEGTTVNKPVAMMTPEEKAFVGKEASRKALLRKQGVESPAAINRRKLQEGLAKEGEKISNDLGILKNRTMATFVRQPTHKHLAATLDGAETLANNAARNSENAVRLPSADTKGITGFKKNFYGNQDILAAANAYYASGAIKTRYNYSLEAMDAADRILQSDEKAKAKNDYLVRIKKNAAIRTHEGKDTPAMHQEVKDVQAELNKLVQNKLLESGHLTQEDATRYHDESAKPKLDEFMARVKLGDEKAKAMLERGGAWDRFRAKRWLKGNAKLMQELEFAKAHWEHPELRETAMQIKKQLDTQFQLERSHGFNISYEENYLPGRYDGELFSGNGVLFGGLRLLGKQFRSAKVFPTYYHAAESGPYIAATRDAASIVGSRVRQGLLSLNRTLWWNSLKGIEDEATGKMIATNGKEKNGRTVTPSPDYHEFHTPTGDKIYVLDGYEKLMHELTDPDALQSNTISRALLTTSQFLKHTVLLGDFFHLGRVAYYAASITGKKTFMRPGWAALDFREEDIPKAVEKGFLAPQDAKWLLEKVAFTADGKPKMVSRMRLSKLFQKSGLNVGQIQDAISKDLVRNVPGFGKYNKFLFDRFTRGLMMNSALREFDRISKLEPGNDSRDILQRVSKDLNVYFGSIGRQGWIKSATFQSIARLTLLAPQWLEGLIKKEASPLRLLTSPKRGLTGHDTMLRGIGRGLLSMIVLTQVINLINRRQPTWQNPPGHKWDAEVGDNVWLSPLAVFNELTADLIRLHGTKPKTWDAIQQIGENKLGFWGRAGMVLLTGKGASGQYKSTTAGLLGEAAKQFVPSPISFGPAARAIGNKIAPSLVSPNPPGKLTQSIYSSSGLKTHVGQTAESAIRQSAEAFNKAHGMTTPPIQYTDDPSYSQLRYLVKIGDLAGAQKMLKSLGKTPQQVMQDMRTWARRPFTGSKRGERLWVAGMSDEERAMYDQAVNQKMQEYQNFEDWYVKTQP